MSTPTIILHESFKDPSAELWFVEPSGFTALPLEALLPEPDSTVADELRSAAAPFLQTAPDETTRQQFIASFASTQQLLSTFRDMGTVHCSIGLHSDDVEKTGSASADGPLFSFFTISWHETAVAPRGVTAARAVTAAEGHSRVEFLELACGPAAFSEWTFRPSAGSDLPSQPLLQLRGFLPHPDCTRLAVLTLSTTAVARRDEYRAILQQIADSVCFENPLEHGLVDTGA
ncbi:hypothetical protein OG866_15655 [Streptomyces sp. NBC_00663]|uniref:hypothetical protein n=1 Tax=Streptomyces sp. NBC_00663 TaxID=2975801 RepID=UPI002E333194|nr:hypothetical protein [Streptomyces sp. NBC_00663]